MRKNKSFLALSALGVFALILMVAAGVLLSGQRAVSFRADGYVLDTAKQDDDTLEVVTDQSERPGRADFPGRRRQLYPLQ